MLAIRGQ